MERIVLKVSGMMCQKNCGTTVQRALEAVRGVQQVEVSFLKQRAIISGSASVSGLIAAVSFFPLLNPSLL